MRKREARVELERQFKIMESEKRPYIANILVIPYPTQGHINPLLQLCKRLVSKGLKATLTTTKFISKSIHPKSDTVGFDTISDGFDEGGFLQSDGVHDYVSKLEVAGRRTLAELLEKQQSSEHPFDCVIYDSFLPWALDVAKQFGLLAASFFTQPCAVNFVYYYVHHGILKIPVSSYPVSLPGLPLLDRLDMPSFIAFHGSYPAYFELVLNQFLNTEKADFVLVNTFYMLEPEAVDTMSKVLPMLTIGPTIPSFYLDNRVENDSDYELNLFDLDASESTNWLSHKPIGSVIYVAFGSMVCFDEKQMEELAWGILQSNFYFLWVVRSTEEEARLPKDFSRQKSEKGLLVRWSPQLKVLSSEAIGCFLSHGGWNSTIEALSLGVPMVVMPQWTDQTTNAKLVEDVWKVGVRVKVDEEGLVGREEIESCIRQVVGEGKGKEMKNNALKWKNLAKEAVSEGGTSDKCIDEFVSKLRESIFDLS